MKSWVDIDPTRERTNWPPFRGRGRLNERNFSNLSFDEWERGGQLRKEGINPGKEVGKGVEITSSRIASG